MSDFDHLDPEEREAAIEREQARIAGEQAEAERAAARRAFEATLKSYRVKKEGIRQVDENVVGGVSYPKVGDTIMLTPEAAEFAVALEFVEALDSPEPATPPRPPKPKKPARAPKEKIS